jgi:hypothetical protein
MALETSLDKPLAENRKLLKAMFGSLRGALFRDLIVPAPGGKPHHAFALFLEGQVNRVRLEDFVFRPLFEGVGSGDPEWAKALPPLTTPVHTLEEANRLLFRGMVLLQTDWAPGMVAVDLSDVPTRAISAPDTESGISGPREAFTENLVLNLTQLRRRMPGPDLRLESHWVGNRAQLELVVAYLDKAPPPGLLDTLRKRLAQIKQDGVQDVTELAEALSDTKLSVFPQVLITERPDIVVHNLRAGRFALLLDNSPRALVMPCLFMDLFVSADDYYEWRPFVIFLRFLRFVAFNIAVPLPGIYVSVTTYHQQALPTQLTLSLLSQREGAPLPPPIEAIVMTLIFEILREAGIRLPRSIGPTVSIVGGLVIGEAAIRSGLTSPAMVLVVSATAVATFSLPSTTLANAATYYRFLVLFLSSTLGFFGLLLAYLIAVANVSSMSSLGVPYTAPLFPLQFRHMVAALGLRARPPANTGTPAPAALIKDADTFSENKE